MKKYFFLILILIITIIAYIPVFNAELLKLDDFPFIINNSYIKTISFNNISYIFSHSIEGYHPLSLITLAIEYKIVGLSPLIYHVDNLLLHLLNCIVLYFVCIMLFKNNRISLIVVILFAISPVNVQTVAYAAERRGLLMAFFYLLSLLMYVKHIENNDYKKYFLSLVLFILSLFSNGRSIPLVLCLILVNYLKDKKIYTKKVIIETIPFLLISIIFGIINIYAQKETGYSYRMEGFSSIDYIFIAGYSYIQYFINLLFPFNLTSGYPYPEKSSYFLPFYYYLYTVISIIILIAFIYFIKKNKKIIVFAITFYTINIILLLRLFSPLTENIMEDHYAYIPSIGIFILIAYILNYYFNYSKLFKKVFIITSIVIIPLLVTLTFQRNIIWQNSMSLFNNMLSKHPNRFVILNNRGFMYLYSGKYNLAKIDFSKAISVKPDYNDPYFGRARVNEETGKLNEALTDYDLYIELSKNNIINNIQLSTAYNNRGVILAKSHSYNEAYNNFNNAIKLNPNYDDPFINLALIYLVYNKNDDAISMCDNVLKKDSKNKEAKELKQMALEKK